MNVHLNVHFNMHNNVPLVHLTGHIIVVHRDLHMNGHRNVSINVHHPHDHNNVRNVYTMFV